MFNEEISPLGPPAILYNIAVDNHYVGEFLNTSLIYHLLLNEADIIDNQRNGLETQV